MDPLIYISLLALLMFDGVSGKVVHIEKRSNVCYGDLGCFSTGPPFFSLYRPVNFLPKSPKSINIRFLLYTRQNRDNVFFINLDDYGSLDRSHFSGTKPTKIVSHGFLENGFVSWMKDMKNAFLVHEDYNVILVDWGGGSGLPYTQATANTRVVGAQISKLIKYLQAHGGAKPQDVHVIGHSLGSHIAGYAGERTINLGRITGLDPAGPYFQNTDKIVRLDPTDAIFVDTIHSDAESLLTLGFGMKQPVGHADYYPNGGHDQPGCDKGVVDQIRIEGDLYNGGKQFVACNHLRSYTYFTESINSACPFTGYHCKDYDTFKQGNCADCIGNSCGQMGFNADKHKPARGVQNVKYYLDTSSTSPFCRYHYHIKVTVDTKLGLKQWRGQMYASLHGTKGQISDTTLGDGIMYFVPGHSYSFITHAAHDIGDVTNIVLHWHHQSSLTNPFQWNPFGLRHPTLSVSRVQIDHGTSHTTFCTSGTESAVQTDSTVKISRKC